MMEVQRNRKERGKKIGKLLLKTEGCEIKKERERENMGEVKKKRPELGELSRSHVGRGEGQRVQQHNILTSPAAAGGCGPRLCSSGMSRM